MSSEANWIPGSSVIVQHQAHGPGPSWGLVHLLNRQMLHSNIRSASRCIGGPPKSQADGDPVSSLDCSSLSWRDNVQETDTEGRGGLRSAPHLLSLHGTRSLPALDCQHTACGTRTPSTRLPSCVITPLLTTAGSSKRTRPVHVECSPGTGFSWSVGVGLPPLSHMGRAAADRLGSKIL